MKKRLSAMQTPFQTHQQSKFESVRIDCGICEAMYLMIDSMNRLCAVLIMTRFHSMREIFSGFLDCLALEVVPVIP